MKKCLGLILATTLACLSNIQAQVNETVIQQSAHATASKYKLSEADVKDYIISDNYTRANGNSYVYLVQTVHGYEIFNAIMQLHFTADGKMAYSNSRFIVDKNGKTNTSTPVITAETALKNAAIEIGVDVDKITVRTEPSEQKNKSSLINETLFNRPVRATLGYETLGEKLVLVHKLIVEPRGTPNMFNVRVDAQTGKVIKINNRTLSCSFGTPGHTEKSHTEYCNDDFISPLKINAVATYNAYPLGVESPIHGSRQLLTGVENTTASPFGWHDVNGIPGEDFTITRGNNVFAYEDQNDEDDPTFSYSPDGGSSLNFNFPLNFTQTPVQNMNASLTNLFVWNNFMHDVTYFYGFDEVSGNFQANNYGNGGAEDDYVHAQGFDGGGTNNANFGTPEDGWNPVMQMYLWYHETGNVFNVNSPSVIAGPYQSGSATFGPSVPVTPITANLVLMQGNNGAASLGCGTITNAAALSGKIALVDRGNCTFVDKALNAQNAGAIAMVLINNQGGGPPTMGGTDNGVNIPCISISQANGNLIKARLLNGPVNVSIGGVVEEVVYDCSFDNGIVSHEYGHGVSTRLTGGPQNSDCLQNEEQAGEGWSDFFSLVMTEKPTSTLNDVRGIGNYADNGGVNDPGIRPFPYTSDMSINPLTYEDIDGLSVPHGVGSVWCTMIWDLYLNLAAARGHSHNLYSNTGGNNIAIQLVMEGLRLQPCNPGFVDARNAILQADQTLYAGANQCIIWKTFARRGLGYSATQGSSDFVGDENEAFDLPPTCSTSDVDFAASPNSACVNRPIAFQNLVIPAATSYSWTFPGGTPSTSTAANPTVTYPNTGNYTVSLTATNANGTETITKQNYIQITQSLIYTVSTTTTLGGNTGTATILGLSGVGPYTYSWNGFPNVTTATNTGLAAGSYSVTVTDQSGCSATQNFVIHNTLGIESELLYSIQLFPNPTSDMLYITSDESNIIRSVRITDISGKQVSNQVLNVANANLDVSALAAGMYMAHVEIGDNVLVKRFVKK
jgi:extracellular elastinolytic metalloproteinase